MNRSPKERIGYLKELRGINGLGFYKHYAPDRVEDAGWIMVAQSQPTTSLNEFENVLVVERYVKFS